jgi:hypothetical protein
MKKDFVRITTADTNETYEFPGNNPQLWEVKTTITRVQQSGAVHAIPSFERNTHYIEDKTLLMAGLEPYDHRPRHPDPEIVETAEDLILRLLENVGVYPAE